MAQIVVEGVTKTFRGPGGAAVDALRDIHVRVADGEFMCLLGPSGCGKTTLLNIMAGLERHDAGSVTIRDESDGHTPVISYMFQESRLLPWMTVTENLAFVLDGRSARTRGRIDDWLSRVGLREFGDYFPRQLSIGMQQRVAVARALIVQPDVLFMDEPFSSLDELTAMTMREELLALWQQLRCTVVFVTHNPMEATLLADRILIMSPGPGRVADVLELTSELPRPRNADDAKLWRTSRDAVRRLRGDTHASHL
ncbi:MAG: ABC transporter ATP-binding protein [Trueperaceae bacterium]|nr:ABC transporter ATP-binding protein [Trueperaceae bacterium]